MLGFGMSDPSPGVMRDWERRCAITGHIPCYQFFTHEPRRRLLIEDEKDAQDLRSLSLYKVVHSAYDCLPLTNSSWFYKIIPEIKEGIRIDAQALVVHIKNGWKENIRGFLDYLSKKPGLDQWPTIFFENHAAKSNSYTLDRLENIMFLVEMLRESKVKVGICLDTAHLWGNGMRELEFFEESMSYLKSLPRDIPLMFHLNDSLTTCGSGIDLHAPVGEGAIWGGVTSYKSRVPDSTKKCGLRTVTNYRVDSERIIPFRESGAAAFVIYARERSLPIILESGGTIEVDRCLHEGLSPRV